MANLIRCYSFALEFRIHHTGNMKLVSKGYITCRKQTVRHGTLTLVSGPHVDRISWLNAPISVFLFSFFWQRFRKCTQNGEILLAQGQVLWTLWDEMWQVAYIGLLPTHCTANFTYPHVGGYSNMCILFLVAFFRAYWYTKCKHTELKFNFVYSKW